MMERLSGLDLLLLQRDFDGAEEWLLRARPADRPLGRARFQTALGNLDWAIRELQDAKDPVELGELALLAARAGKDDGGATEKLRALDSEGVAQFYLARIHVEKGENAVALERATRGIELARAAGDRALLADLHAMLFDIAPSDQAIEHARYAVRLAWEEPLLPMLPRHVADLFLILKASKALSEADEVIADLRKRLRARRKDEARRILGATGVALTSAHWYGTAATLLQSAVEGAKESGQKLGWHLHLAVAQFPDDPAEGMANLSRVFLAAPNPSWLRSMALIALADDHFRSGARSEIMSTLKSAMESFPLRLAPAMEVPLLELLFRAMIASGNEDEALTYGNAALARARTSGSPDLLRRGHFLRSKALIATGELEQAREEAHHAFLLGLRTRHVHDTAQAAMILARLAANAGDAHRFTSLACDLVEAQQADFPRVDQRQRFQIGVQPVFDDALTLSLSNAVETRNPEWFREAFAIIQRFQNRTLTDRARSGRRGRVRRGELVEKRFVETRARRSGAQKIIEFKTRGRNFEPVALPQVAPPTIDEILQTLEPNVLLLTVIEADEMCCLLPATSDGVQPPMVVRREYLDAIVEELQEAARDAPAPAAMDAIPVILRAIADELRIEELLNRARYSKLIVAPDGNLASVPFHALPIGDAWLIDRFADGMICTPSAAFYASTTTVMPKRVLAVAVGDDLAYLEDELARLRSEVADVIVVDGAAATLAEVARLAGDADVFYYMGHGAIAEGDDVLQAKLLLADGVLSTYDLFSGRVPLARGATAILNCCDVGRTAAGTTREMMGFVRGLFHAGATSAVAALWPVDDEIAATMMPAVIAGLRDGVGLAAAMTRAVRAVKSNPAYEHPYAWGAYQWWGR